ncbi:MAG TPA: ABC transporter permease [Acetobacteraceae bacterium]|nr:ABC transporter permease [Acetobacteraceae bacterium]
MSTSVVPRGSDQDTSEALLPVQAQHGGRLVINAGLGWPQHVRLAFADIRNAASLWRLVWSLGFLDIRLRYRGSVLGPFWLTLSTAVMVGALGFVYSHLFHTDIHTYLPFLSLSLVLWNFINALVTDGCTGYTTAEAMIRAMRMPLSLHAARVLVRNLLILAHNIVVIVVVFAIMQSWPGRVAAMALPGFLLWIVDGLAISILLGGFCARFRDVPPIVASVMQIAFFVSPIIWSPDVLKHRGIGVILLNWNPFYALLEIVRAPLLNQMPSLATWGSALGYSGVLILATMLFFIRARGRIAFWV